MRLRRLLRDGATTSDLVHTHSPGPGVCRSAARGDSVRVSCTPNTTCGIATAGRPTRPTPRPTAGTTRSSRSPTASPRRCSKPRWLPTHPGYPPVETLLHGVDVDEARRALTRRARSSAALDLPPTCRSSATSPTSRRRRTTPTLLEAVATPPWRHPDLVTLLIGTGPLEADLRAGGRPRWASTTTCASSGCATTCSTCCPALDVFVLSSRFEGLPISMLEAMASEVACVLTRVGGIPEAVDDGEEGLLVPAGEPMRSLGRSARSDPTPTCGSGSVRLGGSVSVGRLLDRPGRGGPWRSATPRCSPATVRLVGDLSRPTCAGTRHPSGGRHSSTARNGSSCARCRTRMPKLPTFENATMKPSE
jgi:hypothetical protein